ncbi:tetratricopeptide repeat protein [Emticicia sp. SJ17W-69]|uniref:tetratricopeptide repeat protein n=1 Tax=Emticicia sp. SJ17W-69 TaxID=3421657 RepID=UPI003EC00E35
MKAFIISGLFLVTYLNTIAQSPFILIKKEGKLDSIVIPHIDDYFVSGKRIMLKIHENGLLDSFKKLGTFVKYINGSEMFFSLNGFNSIFKQNCRTVSTDFFSLVYGFNHGSFTYYREFEFIYKHDSLTKKWFLRYIRELEIHRDGIWHEEGGNNITDNGQYEIKTWREPSNKKIDFFSEKDIDFKATKKIAFIPISDFIKKIKKEFQQNHNGYFKNTFSKEYMDMLIYLYQDIPNSIEFYNNLGYYLAEFKLYNEAIYILEKVIIFDKFRTVAYLNLGDAYWEIKDFAKAKQMYEAYKLQMIQIRKENKIPERVLKRL